jgi:prophage DNA circulation protein
MALLLAACTVQAQQTPLKPIATVRHIMMALTVPSSDAIFDAASETPKTDQGWTKVGTSALVLAEAGNLLMIGPRAKDKDRWMRMARAQVDAAETVMKAAAAKDADALSKTGDALYETCDACHTRYMHDGEPR